MPRLIVTSPGVTFVDALDQHIALGALAEGKSLVVAFGELPALDKTFSDRASDGSVLNVFPAVAICSVWTGVAMKFHYLFA